MPFKVSHMLSGALVFLAFSGIATSAASASGPFWHVGGKKFESGTRQIKLQSKGAIVLKSTVIEIECKNSISEGATIEGSTTTQGQGKGRISYSSCTVLKPTPGCDIAQPIIMTPLNFHLVETGTQTHYALLLEPAEGVVFVVLKFSGTCTIKEWAVTGSIAAEVIPTKVESQDGLITFPTTPITKVKLEGTEKAVKLETVGIAFTISAAYGARLATFPEKFGVFET